MARMKKKDDTIKNSKRLQCLMKKTRELSILCDIDAFLLCFESSSSASGCCYTWPEDQQTCLSLIKKYKNSLNQPIRKTTKKNQKEQTDTVQEDHQPVEEKQSQEFNLGSHCLDGLPLDGLKRVLCRVDEILMTVEERIQFLMNAIQECTSSEILETQALQSSSARSDIANEVLNDQNPEKEKEESEMTMVVHMGICDFLESQAPYANYETLDVVNGLLDHDFPDSRSWSWQIMASEDFLDLSEMDQETIFETLI